MRSGKILSALAAAIATVVVMLTMTALDVMCPGAEYVYGFATETKDANPDLLHPHQRSKEDRALVTRLTADLRAKLLIVNNSKVQGSSPPMASFLFNMTCKDHNVTNYDDSNKCLRRHIPVEMDVRVDSLAFIDNMPIPPRIWSAMAQMRAQIKGKYDVIIVNAASSNHYDEAQALIRNLHTEVFPVLTNFKFIFYDLGLKPNQRAELQKHCRCTVLTFPFSQLPQHFSTLKCFSWKVFIVAAHFEQAQVIVWTDSSIRISNGAAFQTMVQRTKERGVQQRGPFHMNPTFIHTLTSMFEYFGDSPCSHGRHIRQCETGFGMYNNEALVWHTVIVPWLSCASSRFCMCPQDPSLNWNCSRPMAPGTISVCCRSDQSAMSIILARLFREHYYQFVVDNRWFQTAQRKNKNTTYFMSLEKALH